MTETALYSEVLAKIGAERSKFIATEKINQLAASKNLNELVVQLRDTNYAENLAKVPKPYTSQKLERAFKDKLIETNIKIVKHSPKTVTEFLRLRLLRFEVENVKALAKTTNAKMATEQKLSRIYLQIEDFLKHRAIFEEAAKATELKQIVDILNKTEFAEALVFGLESYEESGTTACLDVLLDKAYYEKLYVAFQSLPKREKAHALYYTSVESDSFTLLVLLRGKNLRYTTDWLRLAVPRNNFNIPKRTIEELLAGTDFSTNFKIISTTNYSKFFIKAQTPEETLAKAEKAFRKALFEKAKSCRIFELFNIGAVLAFMVQAEAEVQNLVALSLGIENGTKPEEIRSQFLK